jgi:hypothetical protein
LTIRKSEAVLPANRIELYDVLQFYGLVTCSSWQY